MTRLARSLGGAIVAAALAASSPLPGLAQARSAPTTLVGPCYPPGTELTVDGPSPRRGMAMANDAAHKQVVLFGGWDGVINLSDTWTWDGTTWTEQHPAHSPSPRRSLGMAYDAFRRQVVLFGGYDGSGDRDDTWIWDGEDWTEQHPAHTPPSNSIFGMAFDAGTRTIVMNGGSAFVFYTTWLWDGSDWLTGHTRAPRWRQLQGMSPDGDGAVMFGGETDDLEGIRVPSNTTFTWDGTKWMLRKPTRHPTFRVGSGMAYDVARDQVILFGGADYGPLDDTWWWTGDTWRELHPRTSPEGRERMGMAYDSAHQQIVVFGGTQDLDDCFFGDTWIWDGVTWTEH